MANCAILVLLTILSLTIFAAIVRKVSPQWEASLPRTAIGVIITASLGLVGIAWMVVYIGGPIMAILDQMNFVDVRAHPPLRAFLVWGSFAIVGYAVIGGLFLYLIEEKIKLQPRFKPLVRKVSYGKGIVPQVVLIAPHRCMWRFLPGYYPSLPSRVKNLWGREFLAKYLSIEEDLGSYLLAHEIARAIVHYNPQYRVDVVAYRMSRGIVDGNRITDVAVQPVFDFQAYPELVVALKALHQATIAKIWEALGALHPQGLVIDCHSMASFEPSADPASPDQAVVKTESTMLEYVDAYLHPTGKLRPFDIVTSTAGGEYLADRQLAEFMADQLTRHGVEWDENEPYAMTDQTMSAHYLRKHKGIVFDAPKCLLTHEQGIDAAQYLPCLRVDKNRVKALAAILAKAICARLAQDQEQGR